MPPQPHTGLGRRSFLLLGTAAFVLPALPVPGDTPDRFTEVSRRLIAHDLNPAVGRRIAAFAAAQHPDLDVKLDRIAAIAGNATRPEDFFDDIPEGELRDLAHWIIASWYSGVSSFEKDAVQFTYEDALVFKPVSDMVGIPSFALSGPNMWGNTLNPLDRLPQF